MRHAPVQLGQRRAHGLEESNLRGDFLSLIAAGSESKGFRQLQHSLDESLPAVLQGKNMLLCFWQQLHPCLRISGEPFGVIKRTEEPAQDVNLLQHHPHGFVLIDDRTTLSATSGVLRDGLAQVSEDWDVLDDQATRLVPEDPVNARD